MRTGDEGYVKNHEIYVVDRLKELIKVRGFQVAPAEVSQEESGCEVAGWQGLWLHNASAGLCALIKVLVEIQAIMARLPDTESHPRSAPRTLSLPPDYERSLTWMPFILARGASAAAPRRRRRVRRGCTGRVLG